MFKFRCTHFIHCECLVFLYCVCVAMTNSTIKRMSKHSENVHSAIIEVLKTFGIYSLAITGAKEKKKKKKRFGS